MAGDREEFDLTRRDHVEEGKLALLDRQLNLRGVWSELYGGCPHYVGTPDSVGRCSDQKMQPCTLEVYPSRGCDVFHRIIEEWRAEYGD